MSSLVRNTRMRNIAIIAHVDHGKTTLVDAMFRQSGLIRAGQEIDDRIMDSLELERERGITIAAKNCAVNWKGTKINIIDTPGHVDFTIEVERSLRVLDGAVVVFCGTSGVEPQSETVWRQADKYRVPKIAFINKLDRVGADFFGTVKMIKERLKAQPLILQLPAGTEDDFESIIDLVRMKHILWDEATLGADFEEQEIPPKFRETAEEYRDKLIETAAEFDDNIMEAYLAEAPIDTDKLLAAIRRATTDLKLVPLLCGAALKNKGIQPLLDAIVQFLPSPLDVPPIKGTHPDSGEAITCLPKDSEPLAALIFKVAMMEGRKLSFIRIYSGHIRDGGEVFNPARNEKEKSEAQM